VSSSSLGWTCDACSCSSARRCQACAIVIRVARVSWVAQVRHRQAFLREAPILVCFTRHAPPPHTYTDQQRRKAKAACVTSALVRSSVLRHPQSAQLQLSQAIIFFRFRNRNACAARWRLREPRTLVSLVIIPCGQRHRRILHQSALRRLSNIGHIGAGASAFTAGRRPAKMREK